MGHHAQKRPARQRIREHGLFCAWYPMRVVSFGWGSLLDLVRSWSGVFWMWSALEFGLFLVWCALGCDLSLLWSALRCGLSWIWSALGCSWRLLNFIMVHYWQDQNWLEYQTKKSKIRKTKSGNKIFGNFQSKFQISKFQILNFARGLKTINFRAFRYARHLASH